MTHPPLTATDRLHRANHHYTSAVRTTHDDWFAVKFFYAAHAAAHASLMHHTPHITVWNRAWRGSDLADVSSHRGFFITGHNGAKRHKPGMTDLIRNAWSPRGARLYAELSSCGWDVRYGAGIPNITTAHAECHQTFVDFISDHQSGLTVHGGIITFTPSPPTQWPPRRIVALPTETATHHAAE